MMRIKQYGFSHLVITLAILVLSLICLVAFLVIRKQESNSSALVIITTNLNQPNKSTIIRSQTTANALLKYINYLPQKPEFTGVDPGCPGNPNTYILKFNNEDIVYTAESGACGGVIKGDRGAYYDGPFTYFNYGSKSTQFWTEIQKITGQNIGY